MAVWRVNCGRLHHSNGHGSMPLDHQKAPGNGRTAASPIRVTVALRLPKERSWYGDSRRARRKSSPPRNGRRAIRDDESGGRDRRRRGGGAPRDGRARTHSPLLWQPRRLRARGGGAARRRSAPENEFTHLYTGCPVDARRLPLGQAREKKHNNALSPPPVFAMNNMTFFLRRLPSACTTHCGRCEKNRTLASDRSESDGDDAAAWWCPAYRPAPPLAPLALPPPPPPPTMPMLPNGAERERASSRRRGASPPPPPPRPPSSPSPPPRGGRETATGASAAARSSGEKRAPAAITTCRARVSRRQLRSVTVARRSSEASSARLRK